MHGRSSFLKKNEDFLEVFFKYLIILSTDSRCSYRAHIKWPPALITIVVSDPVQRYADGTKYILSFMTVLTNKKKGILKPCVG